MIVELAQDELKNLGKRLWDSLQVIPSVAYFCGDHSGLRNTYFGTCRGSCCGEITVGPKRFRYRKAFWSRKVWPCLLGWREENKRSCKANETNVSPKPSSKVEPEDHFIDVKEIVAAQTWHDLGIGVNM
ncbi:uncharacterized protein [Spinacia oleracea]|uniref:Uncharacterized protein n=1 Tax=Spinacia oleracea TaxID=3562 RepID=A0ABM3QVW5_SPIOL|nr:uncharacterized protein LOC110790269 [Spinacia oleracea]